MVELDSFQKDALKEIGNMGAGKASGELSKLINKEVSLTIPNIDLVKTGDVSSLIAGEQQLVVGTYSLLDGDVTGRILISTPTKGALELADLAFSKDIGTTKNVDDIVSEKLKEVGDVLSGAYLNSFTEFLQMEVSRSPERIVSTFGESLADLVVMGIDQEYALFVSTDFSVPETDIQGKFIMLIAIESIQKMIESIKKQLA